MRDFVSNRDAGHYSSECTATAHYIAKPASSSAQIINVLDRTLFAREDSLDPIVTSKEGQAPATQRAPWLKLQQALLRYSRRLPACGPDLEDSQEFFRRRASRVRAT